MSEQDAHERLEDLAGAAALHALTPEEDSFVRAHLAACSRCRTLYGELRTAADLLLRAPEPIDPPPGLRGRVLAEIAATPQDAVDLVSPPAPVRGRSTSSAAPIRFPSGAGRRGWRNVAALVSLAAAIVLGFWTLRLQNEITMLSAQVAEQRQLADAARDGRVVRLSGPTSGPGVSAVLAETTEQSVLYLDNLPQPATNRAYQVWLIPPGGQPVGAGVSEPGSGGRQRIPLTASPARMQTIAITEEPSGGSPAPTGPIIASAPLAE